MCDISVQIAAGLTVSFANPAYTANELAHQIQDSGAVCIFTHPDALPVLLKSLPHSIDHRRGVVLMPHTADIDAAVRAQGYLLLDDLMAGPKQIEPMVIEGRNAVQTTALLYYSSGTTGKSKGVETTHYNIVAALSMIDPNWPAVSPGRDVMMAVIPCACMFLKLAKVGITQS
jgi:long-subunit acyl-CoA synthetase (AMP-forming)